MMTKDRTMIINTARIEALFYDGYDADEIAAKLALPLNVVQFFYAPLEDAMIAEIVAEKDAVA
jgi:hypothetical protein